MTLLDPTAISDPEDYTPDDYRDKGLVIRRFKKDIRDQVKQQFEERETTVLRRRSTAEEDRAFEALLNVPFTRGGRRLEGQSHELLRIGLQKALFESAGTSPSATNQDAGRTQTQTDDVAEHAALAAILHEAITPDRFSRYQRLLTLLRAHDFGWSASAGSRSVSNFERLDTLQWLATSWRLRFASRQTTQTVRRRCPDGTLRHRPDGHR